MKSVWLLGILALALVFAGFAGTASAVSIIDDIKVEAHDQDNQPDNQYGIRLVRITVEGDLNDNVRDVLGTVIVGVDTNANGIIDGGETTIQVLQGDLRFGGHELAASSGTHIVSSGGVDDMIETNNDGEFLFTFALPADAVEAADVTIILWFGNEEGDLGAGIYDTDLLTGTVGEREFEFAVQVPTLKEGQVDDDIYRNGDRVEVQLEYETGSGGPPLSDGEEISLLTILPDFSNVDSAFALGNSEDALGNPLSSLGPLANSGTGRYDLTRWDEGDTDPGDLDLYDLALDVDRAVRDGRLIIDPNDGDYDVTYIISENNLNGSGRKRLFIHALDFPAYLNIFDAPTIFDAAGLDFEDDVNIASWATCATEQCYDDDMGDILLDNMAPNFDFAVIDPFINTPLRKWEDADGDSLVDADEWTYIYKEGDTIRLMIQIDPHDLTEEELNEVDPDEVSDTGNENGTVSNITIIGDISALLDPTKADLMTDANRNGIPDEAEVYTVEYAGSNGEDDDFDGGIEDNVDDDEDSTTNGINERFLYILLIEVDERFRGVAGDRPFTTPGLPIRFMVVDDSDNKSYFSTWREQLFDYDNWKWRTVSIGDWGRDTGLADGVRNPMYLDPEGEDEIFCPDGVYQYPPSNPLYPAYVYSSLSYTPSPARTAMPPWSPGYPIMANWNKPFRVIIDAAYPNVSKIRDIRMEVGHGDSGVAKGAAVVPVAGPNNINNTPATALTGGSPNILTEGNFIYELSGNAGNLVTLEAYFPSDNDMYFVKFEYSDDGVNFEPMKGSFNDFERSSVFLGAQLPRESLLLYDIAGNIMDAGVPGARYGAWHDAINGDDDSDNDPDFFDEEVDDAHSRPQTDNRDNDADGLVDADDRDSENRNTEMYDRTRDDDEDGIMDEDEYIVPVYYDAVSGQWVARWSFDPVRIVRLLDLEPGRPYAIRALAYDCAGFLKEGAAAPVYVVFNVAGQGVPAPSGDAEASLFKADDMSNEIEDDSIILENRNYVLETDASGSVESVTLKYSMNKRDWSAMPVNPNPDDVEPFIATWTPTVAALTADPNLFADDGDGVKEPDEAYAAGDRLYIKAFAGRFGPLGKYAVIGSGLPSDLGGLTFIPYDPTWGLDPPVVGDEGVIEPDVTVKVSDSVAPVMVITQVDNDVDLSDGALAPVNKAVILKAWSDNGDDISDAVFQYARVYPDGSIAQWQDIPSTVDLTILPDSSVIAVSKWDTTGVQPGRYDLRCVSWDDSGNSNAELAPVVHVVVGQGKYAGFIIYPVDGGSVSGSRNIVRARVYNASSDLASIKRVIFQYQDSTGAWILMDSVDNISANNMALHPSLDRGFLQSASYSDWYGEWITQDLTGMYRIKALVEDNQGYVNDGISIEVEVKGAALTRTAIYNFVSDPASNPRVSMDIARDASVPDIKTEAVDDAVVETIRIVLKAEQVGGITPDDVKFQYKINADGTVNPKVDTGWTDIATDTDPSNGTWEVNFDIGPTHPLHNLKVATLVYIRAVAIKDSVSDAYVDEDDFVPYVGLVFEETTEPTCIIARIERDGISVGDDLSTEKRVTGGVLNIIPSVLDQSTADHRASGIAKVELFYKLCEEGDRGKWISAGVDTTPPYAIVWDVSDPIDVATGKYELMMVATDQVGNRSANVRNSVANLRGMADLIRLLTIDHTGPDAFVENPEYDGGRLGPSGDITVSASSYEGCLDTITLWYNTGTPGIEIEEGVEEFPIRRIYQDLNRNGQWDPGEPFRWELPPDDPDWVPDIPGTTGGWVKIGEYGFVIPNLTGVTIETRFADFANGSGYGYYFYDENGNGIYDVGEPVWQDKPGGNTGRYNYSSRTVKEDILMGGPRPSDEQRGIKFEDIPGKLRDQGIICAFDSGVTKTKWADMNANGGLDDRDFIWVDLDGDGAYDCIEGGVGEPIVYASGIINWGDIMNLPPTNATEFELKVQACDKKDSAGKDGKCGPEVPGTLTIGNILAMVMKVNGRMVRDDGLSYKGEFTNKYLRVTGDTVEVVVRVWPEPISGSEVQLWFRYDDDLNPGGYDDGRNGYTAYDGYPDGTDGTARTNSKWDGIDNDWDGVNDENQRDKDGNDKQWGEVNRWVLASTTGGTAISATEVGNADDGLDKNWFEVTLTWDVSMLNDEHQYEFMPIVVDPSDFGVNFNYSDIPWVRSDVPFPQGPGLTADGIDNNGNGVVDDAGEYMEIIIDHQAPYTYTHVVQDTDDYGDSDYAINSWTVARYPESEYGGYDDVIVRTNDGLLNNTHQSWRKGAKGDDCLDEPNETAYKVYDLQAKVVSIYGGLDYTKVFDEGIGGVGKPFNENAGGVMFQYSTDGGATWTDLGYDPDPDYLSTFVKSGNVMVSAAMERHAGLDQDSVGAMVNYTGYWLVHKDGNVVGGSTPTIYTTNTQRIVVATFSLDNVDIASLPPTNGTEYMFRTVAKDIPDVYTSDRQNTTGDVSSSYRDELAVENRIGDDKGNASADQNFMRDVNWRKGVPFETPAVASYADPNDIFRNPHKDIANVEYISGPRNGDGKDQTYTVNNIIPEARIMRVYEDVFWAPGGGFDQVALAGDTDGVHAVVPVGEHVLVEAVVNPTPSDANAWGTSSAAAVDIVAVRFYTRPRNVTTGGWTQTGMWAQAGLPSGPGSANQNGDEYVPNFTIRIDTDQLGAGDWQLMALAEDKNGNMEPFICQTTDEVIVRVEDLMGPEFTVGGLALDLPHVEEVAERLAASEGLAGYGGVIMQMIEPYLNFTMTDMPGLDLNNLGNALFPSNPSLMDDSTDRLPVPKMAGEWLHLYMRGGAYGDIPSNGVTVTVYDKNNAVAAQPTVAYTKDRDLGDNAYEAGKVKHTFTLSEQTALLYLPTWTDTGGNNAPRFENVRMYYKKMLNVNGSGAGVAPPNPYFGDWVQMSSYPNSKGERIWTADMNLEVGYTYFYYFVVDTVGDTWVIPDPRNLTFDEFLDGNVYPNIADWFNGPGGYIAEENIFLNMPLVSKIWLPGTPSHKDHVRAADDELWSAMINLDSLADGVYEVRIEAKDKSGFSDIVSKTIVVDRTPPEIDPDADLKVADRVPANSEVPLQAIIHDSPGVNAIEAAGVLFEISKKGNTAAGESVWQYAISPDDFPPVQMPIPYEWQLIAASMGIPSWLGKIALDPYEGDGFMALWQTPATDQDVPIYVRAVPFDDALNVQVGQANQKLVVVDGSVPKAKVVRASVTRAGGTIEDGADGFVIYPDDKDVTLIAQLVKNPEGTKSVTFQYSLKDPDTSQGVQWITIPATQYSQAVRVPNDQGEYVVVWQVDFSQMANEDTDQYFHVRAVAEDEVGNRDDVDPILAIMILNDIKGPQAYIREIDCRNSLSPHLAVTKRCCGEGDPGSVDVEIEAHNVAAVVLEYRAAGGDWTEIKTITGNIAGMITTEWDVAMLAQGRYELRVTAYDGDGNPMTEPDVVVVIVDHTEPKVTYVTTWVDADNADGFEGDEVVEADGVYRYKLENTNTYTSFKMQVKADATDPTDKVEAKEVVLQYFDRNTAEWKTVKLSDDTDAHFSYVATTDLWTITLSGNNALGRLIPWLSSQTDAYGNPDGIDGPIWLRAMATDYACNENNLDKGIKLIADAHAPTILAVYSGSREYEGGDEPTRIPQGGDTVDLWAKVRDDGVGADKINWRVPASAYNDRSIYGATQFPIPATTVDTIASSSTPVEEHGGVYLFHVVWTTPLNMAHDNFTYDVTIYAVDKARNSRTSDTNVASQVANVLVERDVTPPAAPEIRFLVTHAAGATFVPHTDDSGVNPGVDARIFDEYCAPWYDENLVDGEPNWWNGRNGERPDTIDPQPVRKIIDLADPNKYRVFDTFTDWSQHANQYISRDHLDSCVEIWVRTPELEYGVAGSQGVDNKTWRQYEKYRADSSITPNELETYPGSGKNPNNDSRSRQYLPVNYGDKGHDPGIIRVYLEFARDPNQDGSFDDADGVGSWVLMDNYKDGGASDNNQRYRNPDHADGSSWQKTVDYSPARPMYMGAYRSSWSDFTYSWSDDEHRINKNQEPLKLDDVVRVPLYEAEDASKLRGHAYYWVMGDDNIGDIIKSADGKYGETVWNTCATKDDDDDDYMDANTAVDGWYIVRTWAEDYAGNGNPYKDAGRRNFGYAMVYIQNNDDIAPLADTLSDWQFDDRDSGSGDRVVWEGWHKVRVYTKQSKKIDGYDWYFGAVGHINDVDDSGRDFLTNRFNKFFCDVDFLAVEIQDPVTGKWVETGFSTAPYHTEYMNDEAPNSRRSRWYIWCDSTLVEDGATRLRIVSWDNGGKLYEGYRDIHEEYEDGAHIPGEDERRNFENRGDSSDKDVEIDNPRAQVVLPAPGAVLSRGTTVTIQAIPFSAVDLARNGHDVGRVKFYARRKSATGNSLYDGPWFIIDALDDDLDGLFGEDPIAGFDLDKDGKQGEDDIDQIDTNEPYLVRWTIPDWLVIDDPKTETVIEETAEYYIVAVAGDSDTGPVSQNRYGYSSPQQRPNTDFGSSVEPEDIIWDNPNHVAYDTERCAVVTIQDTTPPRTRILQVGEYSIPSETKVKVGRTVTVYAGDTEVVLIPPEIFPSCGGDIDGAGTIGGNDYNSTMLKMPASNIEGLSGDYYFPGWTQSLLWRGIYTPWSVPYQNSKHVSDSQTTNFWPNVDIYRNPNGSGTYEAEWRPEHRIQLLYAQAEADGSVPAFPQSGQTWADTKWKVAEANAIDLDDNGNPGAPDWKVTNWVTGDEASGMPDGKYYVVIVATDDVGHTTGIPVGTAAAVMPDVVEIWIDNNVEPVTLTAAELKSDGSLEIIMNNQMERGQPLVLYVDPKMEVADLDKVTFMYKAKHDYDWTTITIDRGLAMSMTQPYSVTLSPLGRWSGVTDEPHNIALGNIYQFKAVAEDNIGNKIDSNIIELTVVDKVAEAAIAQIMRIDGFNSDEKFLRPNMLGVARLTGRVTLFGCTDADVVGVTFMYREQGTEEWMEIEALLNRTDWGSDGFDNDYDGNVDEPDEGNPWDTANWLTDGIDNDGDGLVDEPGECGYHYEGQQTWQALWDTTTLMNGVYELTVVANTGDNKSDVSDILIAVVDHNAQDIVDAITDSTPRTGDAVGGWCRRQISAENPILDPDDKDDCATRGEVDVCVVFGNGVPPDLDWGVPTGIKRDNNGISDDEDCLGCDPQVDEFDENLLPNGTALNPSLSFEYKMAPRPDIGDENVHDKTVVEPGYYWKPIQSAVIYDAASRKFCSVWRTVADEILNGYYDIRVRVVDEAGNVAYKVIAENVIVDNIAPESMITSVDSDTTLTYVDDDGQPSDNVPSMATDTEIAQDSAVTIRATAVDSLTDVAYVQFQVRASTIQSGRPLAGNSDEINLLALDLTDWTDIGLVTKDDNPEHSYSIRWDTTGMLEGDYLLRVEAVDIVGNKKYSGAVRVTVVDTVPPVATIVGYYPEQLQFLRYYWPKKYWLDNIYAATICQADVQEVQIQARRVGTMEWITIGVPTLIPFEQLDTPEDKADEVRDMIRKTFFPPAVAKEEAILEAFNWTGLWGATWKPDLTEGAEYELRAIAKDWSGNVTPPDLAPVLKVRVDGGMINPVTPGVNMDIEFTANLGGTGVGDPTQSQANGLIPTYNNMPTVVVTVEAPDAIEAPTVLVLVELDAPQGLVYGGEIIETLEEEGNSGVYSAALKGDELMIWIANQWEPLDNYLELLRLGGKITAFATVTTGKGTTMASTSLTMNDLRVFPVTAELGTNGTVSSKDGAVKVMVPHAALRESYLDVRPGTTDDYRTYVQKAGLLITPVRTAPNTPKDQRLSVEPVGQAYNIQMMNGDGLEYIAFRAGFEPKITIDYSSFNIPADGEALGFISVRYWDPFYNGGDGRWANDDIINLSVNKVANTVSFNLKSFGYITDGGLKVPHTIFSIVLEKSLGRINEIVFNDSRDKAGYVYPDEPGVSYLSELADGTVYFRISDPAGIDESSIRVYIDGELYSVGLRRHGGLCDVQRAVEGENERLYSFDVPDDIDLTESYHVLKIEAWDKSDAVNELDWQMLEATATFFIDRTPPVVVTHAAQRDGRRWFSTPEGAVAAITIVDEGVGLSAADLQRSLNVDVFKHLRPENTPLRTIDQGNVVNFQRKVLQATSRPILEFCDEYTPDGIDNEVWTGIYSGASNVRHKAWRASYTIQMGQIANGDTYEVVFYSEKLPAAIMDDDYNENAIYLYEDLVKAYLLVVGEVNTVNLGSWYLDEFYKHEIMPTAESDPFTGYYKSTFLVDLLGNAEREDFPHVHVDGVDEVDSRDGHDGGHGCECADQFFTRNLVADTRGPTVVMDLPDGARADDAASTVSASITDDDSGILNAQLIINGEVVAEENGPVSSVSLEHTFGPGEALTANEIKVVVVDAAGNKTTMRGSFGVQEVDAPIITDMTPQGDGVADATPSIGAAYSDASGIDLSSVTLTLNGAVLTNVTVGESQVSYTPVTPLKTGVTYTVRVAVKDKAGKASEKIWTFALETDGPTITDTAPSGVDETGMPTISARFADAGTGINKGSVKLMVDDKLVSAEVTNSSATYKPSSVMKKGKHTAKLTVADVAENTSELSWDFTIEETPPVITGIEPSGTIDNDMPILSARYSDAGTGIDIKSVTMSLNGENVYPVITESQVSYSVRSPLKAGVSYSLLVTVADMAGNVGTGSSSFRLESTAPSISNTLPTGTVQSVDVTISATYSDAGSGVDYPSALMKLDGLKVPATATPSGISYQARDLVSGAHTVYVEVADEFGNVVNRSWSFTVEQTPPVISSIEPTGEIPTAMPTITVAYEDVGTGVDPRSVVLSLNGQVLSATATETKASYAVRTALEKDVTYIIAVQVADKAGNIASGEATFNLETKAPVITVERPTGTVSEEEAAKGINITAKLDDGVNGSGVNPDSVEMWIDGQDVDCDASTLSVSFTAEGLGYGEHVVRLVVADMLGNVADTTFDFDVDDSTPPTVVIVSPKQDAVVGVQPLIKISYADEGSGVDLTTIVVKVDDNPVMASAMAPAEPSGAKVVSAGEASYEVKLSYGAHTLTVAVKDVAGNEATAQVEFVVEGDALKVVRPHNYPNPFGGDNTTITFGLSQQADVTIMIYDFTATLVATVAKDEPVQAASEVTFPWDGSTDAGDGAQLANGVYFCKILAKTDSETKYEIIKIALVKGD